MCDASHKLLVMLSTVYNYIVTDIWTVDCQRRLIKKCSPAFKGGISQCSIGYLWTILQHFLWDTLQRKFVSCDPVYLSDWLDWPSEVCACGYVSVCACGYVSVCELVSMCECVVEAGVYMYIYVYDGYHIWSVWQLVQVVAKWFLCYFLLSEWVIHIDNLIRSKSQKNAQISLEIKHKCFYNACTKVFGELLLLSMQMQVTGCICIAG